jgi:hypothetical protein
MEVVGINLLPQIDRLHNIAREKQLNDPVE